MGLMSAEAYIVHFAIWLLIREPMKWWMGRQWDNRNESYDDGKVRLDRALRDTI